uniref:Odorant receptor n=1 Tax=Eucryptorrhynchus scrobiculatus TaxID=1552824 RepID=A0A8F4MWV1_EUCSC|nr:odorant receptor 21 [Eucryptorrhynchus scrobiculatus]
MGVLNSIKNDFFGVCMPLAYYFCMLPSDVLENRNERFRLFYDVYAGAIYMIAIFCHASQLVKLYQILADENFIFDELIRNYIITLYHFNALIKCIFLRGKVSSRIYRTIIEYENKIYQSQNESLISIYKLTLSSTRNTKRYYLAGIVLVVVFYIAAPAFRDPYYIQRENETIIVPQVPLSSWTLVDDKYWYAFAWTSAAGTYLSIFFVTTDLICYSFIAFSTCQLDILQYYINNFHEHSQEIMDQTGCTKTESFRIFQRECLKTHQDIISYVKALNGSLKKIMMLDFLPSSIQLAGIIFQMMTNLSVIQCTLLGHFVCTLIARIFIYCNSADNLAAQSQNIATAWYQIDWTELPYDVRKNIVLCIARSQKPLTITIGDFQAISLGTFLVILKGTYSYMMLLTTV